MAVASQYAILSCDRTELFVDVIGRLPLSNRRLDCSGFEMRTSENDMFFSTEARLEIPGAVLFVPFAIILPFSVVRTKLPD